MARSSKKQRKVPPEAAIEYVLIFDGQDDFITCPEGIVTSSYTKEAWVKLSDPPVESNNILSGQAHALYMPNAGRLLAGHNGQWGYVQDASVSPRNTWLHVAVTYDSQTKVMALYRDGQLISQASDVPPFDPADRNLLIGSYQGSYLFKGQMAEARLWNRALSQTEIQSHRSQRLVGDEPGLVGYWPLNEGSGAIVHDKTSNDYQGILHGNPSWEVSTLSLTDATPSPSEDEDVASFPQLSPTTEVTTITPVIQLPTGSTIKLKSWKTEPTPLSVLAFDGIDDRIELSQGFPSIEKAITIEFWAEGRNSLGQQTSVIEAENTQNFRVLNIHLPWQHGADSQIFWDAGNDNGFDRIHKAVTLEEYSVFTHWAFVKDADTGRMSIYRDGEVWHQEDGHHKSLTGIAKFAIGSLVNASHYWKGLLVEFRIWNQARTQAEIQQNKNSRLAGTEPGLVGYWPLNEGSGAIVHDKTSNDYQGILHGNPSWEVSTLSLTDAPSSQEETSDPAVTPMATINELLNKPVLIENQATKRYLFGDGEPIKGQRGEEGGWLESPKVVGADANYYNRALWTIVPNGESFLIENQATKRYLFGDGEPIKGNRGEEGGWLESPKVVGADANYYNRALWTIVPNGESFLIENQATKRYLFGDGEPIKGNRGEEGGWLAASGFESPKVVGADANYYNHALWTITLGIDTQPVESANAKLNVVEQLSESASASPKISPSPSPVSPEQSEAKSEAKDVTSSPPLSPTTKLTTMTPVIKFPTGSTIKLKSWKGDYLHRPDSVQGVTTWNTGIGNEWEVEAIADNKFKLKSWKGDYLHRPDSAQDVTTWNTGIGNEWEIEAIADNKFKLKSWKGDYLHRPDSAQGVTTWSTGIGNEWEVEFVAAVLQFDGQTNYIEIPHSSVFEVTYNFTVEAWFSAQTLEGYRRIFSKFPGFGAGLVDSALLFTTYWLQDYAASVQLTAGTWYHLAVVFDLSNSASFYLNGELVQTIAGEAPATLTTNPLEIGRKAEERGEYFYGQLAELRLWNRAKTQAEIQASKSYRLSGDEPNLVGYWPLDDASGATVQDKTSHANHGSIRGTVVWSTAPLELGAAELNKVAEVLQEQAAAAPPVGTLAETVAPVVSPSPAPIIIELEDQTPQALEEFLSKGDGLIYDSVDEVLDQLKAQGTIARKATPIFVIISSPVATTAALTLPF